MAPVTDSDLPMPTNQTHQADEDQYRRTLDSLLEGFQIIGFDWTYQYVNPAAAQHGRRSPQELIGRRMGEAYPGIEQTALFDILRRSMTERTSQTIENQFTFPDGTMRWFEIRVEPVPQGICVYSADIQDRKDAEAQRLRVFKATMTTVHDIVNNSLTNLQLVRLQAEGRLDDDLLTLFDQIIDDTATKIKALGSAQAINERRLAIGVGIEYPHAAT